MLRNLSVLTSIFFSLLKIKRDLKKKSLYSCLHKSYFKNKYINLNQPDWFYIRLINKLYTYKIFSCLECSILIKSIYRTSQDIKLVIGVKMHNSNFDSHAWVEKANDVIFGRIINLEKYKRIFTL